MLYLSSPDKSARTSGMNGSLPSHPVRRGNGTVPNSAVPVEQGATTYFKAVFVNVAPIILSALVLLHIVHLF